MANAGAKLSSFPEVNDIQTGDMFPLLSDGNTNAKIDYATLARAIIAKLKSEDVVQTQTNNANKLISAALAYSMNQSILQLEEDTSTEQEEKSVTAEIVTVDDADGGEAGLTLNLEPTQSGSGDPSPSNIRPISGWTGANVWDDPAYGGTIEWNQLFPEPTKMTHATKAIPRGTTFSKDDKILIIFNGSKIDSSGATASGYLYFGKKSNIAAVVRLGVSAIYTMPTTITADGTNNNNANSVWLYIARFDNLNFDNYSVYNLTKMFGAGNEPSTVEEFRTLFPADYYEYNAGEKTTVSAVNGNEYRHITIPFGDTVYGGTLDVTTGVLTVDRAQIASYNGETLPGKWISDRDVYAAGTSPTTGAQVVYELATPVTYQLTPIEVTTLLGDNTIWMDAEGTIKLDYKTNAVATKGDVNNALARIKALAKITEAIAPVESSYTATQNYAIGDYLIVDYKLYKVTAAITSGATITEGTNVTATTIMAEIQALA